MFRRPLRPSFRTATLIGMALGLSLASAQTLMLDDAMPDDEEPGGLLTGGLLRDGSILKGVILPTYDANLNLSGTVAAEEMTIVSREEIRASGLMIRFFNPDRTPRGRIAMARAVFKPAKDLNLLTTDEPVSFVSDDLTVDGSGLVFDTDRNRGFLHGPVTAVSKKDLRTSMNAQPTRRALAAGALMMASTAALTAQEGELTSAEKFARLRLSPAELTQLEADTASRGQKLVDSGSATKAELETVANDSEEARITMNSFFQAAALASLLAEPAPATGPVPRPETPTSANEMTITSKDGVYLDSVEGLAIFLKEVKVTSPQFVMSGADEVKVFMAPQKPAAPDKKEPSATGTKPPPTPEELAQMRAAKDSSPGGMGDIRKVVATGVVVVDYKSKDPSKPPAKASARTMIYDLEKEQIILRGGSPWFIRADGTQAFVNGEKAYIVIQVDKNGDVQTVVTHDQDFVELKGKLKPSGKDKDEPRNQPEGR